MKLTFYIARHGKTVYNTIGKAQGWCDSPLTKEGIEVAQYLGLGLRDVNFGAVYTSDLERTVQTAKTVLNKQGQKHLPISQLAGLKESCFGMYESDSTDRLWNDVALHLQYPNHEVLSQAILNGEITNAEILDTVKRLDKQGNAENFAEVEKRTHAALKEIVKRHEFSTIQNILIVSHGMSIRVMLTAFGANEITRNYIQNASISILHYIDGTFKLESLGDTSYLEKGEKGLF